MHPRTSSHLLGRFSGGGKHESLCLLEAHIDLLEDRDSKCSGFAGTGLRLDNDITVMQARDDGALLDGGRLLKTVLIDATQQLITQVHVIKVLCHGIPVGLQAETEQVSFLLSSTDNTNPSD